MIRARTGGLEGFDGRRNRPLAWALRRAAVFAASLASFALAGCKEQSDRLLVATAWNRADRSAAAERFLTSYREHHPASTDPPLIEWVLLEPDADPVRLIERARPPDVVLGVREADLARLEAIGILVGPLFAPARAQRPVVFPEPSPREVAREMIGKTNARGDYGELVRLVSSPDARPHISGGRIVEPVVALAGSRRLELARFFAESLRDWSSPVTRLPYLEAHEPAASFLALMLESITVDARDELAAAGRALERAGRPAAASAWLVEPPPWPPASVAKLLDRPDQSGDVLVIRLAESLVPDPARRDALVRSWLAPPRPIDEALARELAGLAEGKLIQEPRLRDWLRAEWTAWARQRFRRVARLAAGGTAP